MTQHYIWDWRRFLFFPEVSEEYLARFTKRSTMQLTLVRLSHGCAKPVVSTSKQPSPQNAVYEGCFTVYPALVICFAANRGDSGGCFKGPWWENSTLIKPPLNIQTVDVLRGLKRQQTAASTNFVGCFLLALSYFFFSLLLTVLNDLTGPSAGPLAQITYSYSYS